MSAMNIPNLAIQLIDALIPAAKGTPLSYVELIHQEGDTPASAGSRLIHDDLTAIKFQDIDLTTLAPDIGQKDMIELSLPSERKQAIPCIIQSLTGKLGRVGYALFEFTAPPR